MAVDGFSFMFTLYNRRYGDPRKSNEAINRSYKDQHESRMNNIFLYYKVTLYFHSSQQPTRYHLCSAGKDRSRLVCRPLYLYKVYKWTSAGRTTNTKTKRHLIYVHKTHRNNKTIEGELPMYMLQGFGPILFENEGVNSGILLWCDTI